MFNWENSVLKESDTMEIAIRVLDRESLRIIMVVDNDSRLIGTITDGDIRRGLINQLPMSTILT